MQTGVPTPHFDVLFLLPSRDGMPRRAMDSGGLRSARKYLWTLYLFTIIYYCVLIHYHAYLFSDDYWITFVSKLMYGVHNSQVPVMVVGVSSLLHQCRGVGAF